MAMLYYFLKYLEYYTDVFKMMIEQKFKQSIGNYQNNFTTFCSFKRLFFSMSKAKVTERQYQKIHNLYLLCLILQEQEVIRTVNRCCPGYHEDENGERCITRCPDCVHGECDSNNSCNCHPGFWGKICDKSRFNIFISYSAHEINFIY